MITDNRRVLYPNMTENEIAAIDAAFDEVAAVLKIYDIAAAGDDRAENFVGAIARFVKECRL